MLVLTRRVGEEIVIDGDIRVAVVDVSGERVRLGVSAPPSVRVDRLEIYERRARLRQRAQNPAGQLLCADQPKQQERRKLLPKRTSLESSCIEI